MSGWPVRYEKIIRYPDYSYPYMIPPYPRYTCVQECVPICRPYNNVACSAAGAQIILNKKGEPIKIEPIPISKSSVKIGKGRSKTKDKSDESRSSSNSESYSEYSDEGESSSNYRSSSKRKSKSKGSKNRRGRKNKSDRRGSGDGGSRSGGGKGEGGSTNITDVIKDGKNMVDNVQGISDTFNQTASNIRDLPSRCTIL